MRRPPWHWWFQLRDIIPVLLGLIIVIGFLVGATVLTAHLLVALMSHIRDAWNKPS
jgi:hypothetical protein